MPIFQTGRHFKSRRLVQLNLRQVDRNWIRKMLYNFWEKILNLTHWYHFSRICILVLVGGDIVGVCGCPWGQWIREVCLFNSWIFIATDGLRYTIVVAASLYSWNCNKHKAIRGGHRSITETSCLKINQNDEADLRAGYSLRTSGTQLLSQEPKEMGSKTPIYILHTHTHTHTH